MDDMTDYSAPIECGQFVTRLPSCNGQNTKNFRF